MSSIRLVNCCFIISRIIQQFPPALINTIVIDINRIETISRHVNGLIIVRMIKVNNLSLATRADTLTLFANYISATIRIRNGDDVSQDSLRP